jgi:hypothetical protein
MVGQQHFCLSARLTQQPIEAMPMPHYRVHILDRLGDLLGAADLACTDDEAAKKRIEQVLVGQGGELWRRVAVFQPDESSERPLRRGNTRIRDHKQRTKSH